MQGWWIIGYPNNVYLCKVIQGSVWGPLWNSVNFYRCSFSMDLLLGIQSWNSLGSTAAVPIWFTGPWSHAHTYTQIHRYSINTVQCMNSQYCSQCRRHFIEHKLIWHVSSLLQIHARRKEKTDNMLPRIRPSLTDLRASGTWNCMCVCLIVLTCACQLVYVWILWSKRCSRVENWHSRSKTDGAVTCTHTRKIF